MRERQGRGIRNRSSPGSRPERARAAHGSRTLRTACRASLDATARGADALKSIARPMVLAYVLLCVVTCGKFDGGIRMYAMERQELIERLLLDEGRVSVIELARRFEVTTETVRRDLDQLERTGALRRVHGGAVTPRSRQHRRAHPRRALAAAQRGEGRHRAPRARAHRRAVPRLGLPRRRHDDAGRRRAARGAPRGTGGRVEVVTHAMTLAHTLAGASDAVAHRHRRAGAHGHRGRRRRRHRACDRATCAPTSRSSARTASRRASA